MENKNIVKTLFTTTAQQDNNFKKFINELINFNNHTNIVGRSTLANPWKAHILDCIQISPFIKNKNSTILDMGTGAGLPGLVLVILGYNKVSLIDSNSKKNAFILKTCKKLNLKANVMLGRIEKLKKSQYDVLVSRALAKLSVLLSYSQNLMKKNSILIFLKGKNVLAEIEEAEKSWKFDAEIKQSLSDTRGKILIIKNLVYKKWQKLSL